MKPRQIRSRTAAVMKGFLQGGGKNPELIVEGDRIIVRETAVNSTECEEGDRAQAMIDDRLGGPRSVP